MSAHSSSADTDVDLPQKSLTEKDEILVLLRCGLPKEHQKLWYKADALQSILKAGGLPLLPDKLVTNALKTNRNNNHGIASRKYLKKNWYCFDEEEAIYDTPTEQDQHFKVLQTTVLQSEIDKIVPPIPTNHFRRCQLRHLRKYCTPAPSDDARDETPQRRIDESQPREDTPPAIYAPWHTSSITCCQPVTPSPSASLSSRSKPKPSNVFNVPIKNTKDANATPTGIVLMDLDRLDKFHAEAVEKHARSCHAGLKVVKQVKEGWELDRTYYCAFCKQTYEMSTGPAPDKDSSVPKKRGAQPRPINQIMSLATFNSGANATQSLEIFHESGVVCPSKKGHQKMLGRVSEVVLFVSEEQLKKNRKKHNAEARKLATYKGDHKFKDASGVEHSFCTAQVAVDGNGEKRAYGHIITGEQHCTVVVSLVTGDPLYVWHDQISCVHCQRKLTELLNKISNQKRATDITSQDLEHPGKPCFKNSKHGPASAEEWAVKSLAEFLLIDPDTGKFRPDDEAILADFVIADGDTKGPNKFIKKQADLVPSFEGKAEYLPDIGHFIKCISNSFYKLATSSPELKGKSLLEAPRIRCMCGDISKYLREYGAEYKFWSRSNDPKAGEKLDLCRDRALARIAALVHHHCGDHEHCSAQDCKYRQTENHYYAKHRVENEKDEKDKKLTREEILDLHEDEINKDFAANSRFKGMSMSMGKAGWSKIMNEITKRLDAKNIDRVALAMSSNRCENYFSVLVKYTCGKRIYFGRKDGWKVRCQFVAAKRSNGRITDDVRKGLGVTSTSAVRELSINKQLREKEYIRQYKQLPKVKERRKAKKLISSKNVVSNSKNAARHKTEKLSPKENVKSDAKKSSAQKQERKRKNPCPNCKGMHPGKCPEPDYKPKRKRIKTKFNAAYMSSLFSS